MAAEKKTGVIVHAFFAAKKNLCAEKEFFPGKDREKLRAFFMNPWRYAGKGQSLRKSSAMSYKIQPEGEGTCLECGTAIYGRKDKHFCSANCKNTWHNRLMRERRKYRMETIATLSRNYEILEAMLKENRQSAGLAELSVLGFDPDCVTGHRKGRCRHDEYSCFDIRYYRSGTKIFNVRRKGGDGR